VILLKKGEQAHNFKDLTDMTIGRLHVIKRVASEAKGSKWLCECKCGNIKIANQAHLLHSVCPSCGCYQHEILCRKHGKGWSGAITHGLSDTRLYEIWTGMLKRCRNPRIHAYKDYGGRGITVCRKWEKGFMAFYNWAMAHGYADELTLDRKDNDGNYEPANCRWVTYAEQSLNTRKTHYIIINGTSKPMSVWAKEYGVPSQTIYHRIKRGWSGEDLLKPPDNKIGNRKKGVRAVFKGEKYRAMLIISNKISFMTFALWVLDSKANINHSYTKGDMVYNGLSIDEAMIVLQNYVPGSTLPRKVEKYLSSPDLRRY
jgi:hypothetical protein